MDTEHLLRLLRQCATAATLTTGEEGEDHRKLSAALALEPEDVPDYINSQVCDLECHIANCIEYMAMAEAVLRWAAKHEPIQLPSTDVVQIEIQYNEHGWTICIPYTEQPPSYLTRPVNDVETTRYFPTFFTALEYAVEQKWVMEKEEVVANTFSSKTDA